MPRALRWRDLIVGAVILGLLLITTVATLKYARIGRLAGDTVRFYTALSSARNVLGGTEVWINGAKVGKVKSVRFAPPTTDTARRVVLELEVLDQYRAQIRQNSFARLRTGARVLGATVVYVSAGTSDVPAIPPNDTIPGLSDGDMQAVLASFGDVKEGLPEVVANIRVLSSALESTRGTIGALTTLDGPQRLEALRENASRLTRRASDGGGTLALALGRGDVMERARTAAAQADSLRQLLASERSSLGRFRRDSTLLRAVGDVRDELSITRALLASQRGTSLARFGRDSIIAVQMAEMEKQMTELFTDIKRRPFRYIAF